MTKKISLFISLVAVIFFVIAIFSVDIKLCPSYSYSYCSQFFNIFAETIFISIPLLFFSLITYKMREEVFRSWIKFTYVWIPLTLTFVFLAPEYGNSFFPVNEKGFVSFSMSALFLIISLIIIISKSLSPRTK